MEIWGALLFRVKIVVMGEFEGFFGVGDFVLRFIDVGDFVLPITLLDVGCFVLFVIEFVMGAFDISVIVDGAFEGDGATTSAEISAGEFDFIMLISLSIELILDTSEGNPVGPSL
jgi:hypothetical protein